MTMLLKGLLTWLLLFPVMLFAQDGQFLLKGRIGKLNPPAKAYLCIERNGKENWDSTLIKNGEFKFTGTTDRPVLAYLFVASGVGNQYEKRKIYLYKGTTVIQSDNSLANAEIPNSPLNRDFELIMKPIDSLTKILDNSELTDQAKRSVLVQETEQQINISKKKFIINYPGSYFSVVVLNELNNQQVISSKEAKELYDDLIGEWKKSSLGKELNINIERRRKLYLGAIAPDVSQLDMDGKKVSLTDFRGKYVLLDFWASWCKPCREESPYLISAYKKYNVAGFTILSVSLDKKDAKDKWLAAIQQDGVGMWHHSSDLNGFTSTSALEYAVTSIPRNFLIDPTGKIVAFDLRGTALEAKLSEIFGR